MSVPNHLAASRQMPDAALVLVHDRRASLWDPEVDRLAGEVAERLKGVYVTCASTDGRAPGLADAFAATRYAGHSRAVLVSLGTPDAGLGHFPAHGLRLIRTVAAWDADSVVGAYRAATRGGRLPHAGAA